jgi:hypothetical protein
MWKCRYGAIGKIQIINTTGFMLAIIKVRLSFLWRTAVFLVLLFREAKFGSAGKGTKNLVSSFTYVQCLHATSSHWN